MKFRTKAIHVGNERCKLTGAVVPPIHLASTYVQDEPGVWGDYDYSRSGNPTRDRMEETLAALENGIGALAFSSGMAATPCVTLLLNSGDHIVAGADIYGGTYRLLHKICNRSGIEVSLTDATDPANLSNAIQSNTKLIWIESPGNPLMSITDITASATVASEAGVLIAVDNTFATPALTRPLDLGVDIVMHSATKYLGGHSDALGGALVVKSKELLEQLYFIQNATGNCMSPLDSFLISRGMKTLDLRVKTQSENALTIAKHLSNDSRIKRVLYPGLPEFVGHEAAAKQMEGGFGGMLSFEVIGDFEKAKRVTGATQLFQLAVSLGAVESLIEQPASMSHASYDRDVRLAHGISDELIRLSVGLEDVDDLITDLELALDN
ncbi:MAG: PLP-dependent aspartate aminotransferase family protein [Pirellulales bacterium]|nr:PLP-dependent aspartate aminotransferase family protein [Pirellulales bacterium]